MNVRWNGIVIDTRHMDKMMKHHKTPSQLGELQKCTAYKQLLTYIPAKGVTISCPVHPAGHFLQGPEDILR